MAQELESWREEYEMIRRRQEYLQLLVEEANALFEENEDLKKLLLIGGLAIQEFYSERRRRVTSDIDLVASEELVKRLKEKGYIVYYNSELDKYSARVLGRPSPTWISILIE